MRSVNHTAPPPADARETCPPFVVDRGADCLIRMYVQPRARTAALVGMHGDRLKIRVAAPPADGQANEECRHLLAEQLQVSVKALRLVRGHTSRAKDFTVQGMHAAHVAAVLDPAQ